MTAKTPKTKPTTTITKKEKEQDKNGRRLKKKE